MQMAGHDIVVIGASAGGVDALTRLVRGLPPGLLASLFVVCHFPPGVRSVLPEILSRAGRLLASHAMDGELFHPGHIYIAPPDCHLLLSADNRMQLTRGPRENYHRPAIDPLFRSAARVYGRRVIGVILSGAMHDGTAGLLAVRAAGGMGVVQDPADAWVAGMPESAAQIAGADHVASADELAGLLVELIQRPILLERGSDMVDPLDKMADRVNTDMAEQVHNQRRGQVSVFGCPECGGPLWQVDETQIVRFRCHVGHIYQAENLLTEQANGLEAALWTAVRTFKERFLLSRQLAERERERGAKDAADRFEEMARQAEHYGKLVQQYLLNGAPETWGASGSPPSSDESKAS